MKAYRFNEIQDIPEGPGVYAWYYRPKIGEQDLAIALQSMVVANLDTRKEVAAEFLKKHIFDRYKRGDYEFSIRGDLKPQYKGQAQHQQDPPKTLIDRIADDPGRLRGLVSLLEDSLPEFSSPIYVGMSKTLRARISVHK